MNTVFDSPQARIVPDSEGRRTYGNVDNAVEVNTGEAAVFVYIAVPTFLFTFMRDVARIHPATEVHLSLDRVNRSYVFSLLAGENLYDLWSYTEATLPGCFREALAN